MGPGRCFARLTGIEGFSIASPAMVIRKEDRQTTCEPKTLFETNAPLG